LAWILVTKLAPCYYNKLDQVLKDTGRYRELPAWRKLFKREWKKCAKTLISTPVNPKYRPNPSKWVCTCPHFSKSRFLICKHLVQAVHPVPPTFFLEVSRNRSTPFWSHQNLVSLTETYGDNQHNTSPGGPSLENVASGGEDNGEDGGSDEEDGAVEGDLVDTLAGVESMRTFQERFDDNISLIRNFLDGLEYQRQFRDLRMLESLERNGSGFLRLARNCLERERRQNSTRAASPSTWEHETANAMYYRARPRPADRDT
jgi:hypothetical protein